MMHTHKTDRRRRRTERTERARQATGALAPLLGKGPGRYVLPGELRTAMRGHWVSAAFGVLLLLAVSCVCGWCWHRLKHVEMPVVSQKGGVVVR